MANGDRRRKEVVVLRMICAVLGILCLALLIAVIVICVQGDTEKPVERPDPVSIYDLEKYASQTMDRDVRTYVNDGATTQTTLKANTGVFPTYRFRPRPLVDVSDPTLTSRVLNRTFFVPLGVAPMAHHDWVVENGETLSARAAHNQDVVLVLSAQIGDRMEDTVQTTAGHVWQETHMYTDRQLTLDFVRRIENTKRITAIVLGIAIPAIPIRYTKFTPPKTATKTAAREPAKSGVSGLNPAMTWADVEWLVSQTSLPVILKGVLRGEDAVKASSIGVAGVIVSNQGGRVLDGTVTSLDALSEVATAVNGTNLEVYFDGGVRTGMDAVKAMILGAKLVFVGRPVMWGLHHSGQQGVEKVFEILKKEMINTLQLIGARSPRDLSCDMLLKPDSSTDVSMNKMTMH